jgi:hypothetical protein
LRHIIKCLRGARVWCKYDTNTFPYLEYLGLIAAWAYKDSTTTSKHKIWRQGKVNANLCFCFVSIFSIHILAKQEIAENISSHAFPSLLWFLLMKDSHATCSEPRFISQQTFILSLHTIINKCLLCKCWCSYVVNSIVFLQVVNYFISYHDELAENNLWVFCILFLW